MDGPFEWSMEFNRMGGHVPSVNDKIEDHLQRLEGSGGSALIGTAGWTFYNTGSPSILEPP
jgi:hypothetical protein